MLRLISFLLLVEFTCTCSLFSTTPHTHNSHFCKLTTFVIVELFFLYDLPRVKTLCDLTSSCCYKAPLLHTHTKSKHKKNQRKKTQEKKKQRRKKKQYKWKEEENKNMRKW
jgi:hypothetical protein